MLIAERCLNEKLLAAGGYQLYRIGSGMVVTLKGSLVLALPPLISSAAHLCWLWVGKRIAENLYDRLEG